ACNAMNASEATPKTCDNDRDDDDDDLMDCEDPDCHAFAICRRTLTVPDESMGDDDSPQDGGPEPPPNAPTDDADDEPEPPPAVMDAGVDSGVDLPSDAGLVEADGSMPDVCDPLCADDEFCNDGTCETVGSSATGRFEVRILSATVPDRNFIHQCYDVLCDNMISIPWALCDCAPATYVRVLHSRAGVSVEAGITELSVDTLTPEWNEAFEVDLEPGDVLIFEVFDDDPGTDTLIYACSPDLTDLADGPIECMTAAGPPDGMLHGVKAEITQR
ncbi:MAG: C2 domain-containing protein, partial [Myxococcales bacterium]|nr:C2 domain-containing protein [Myxococcales bacterium]